MESTPEENAEGLAIVRVLAAVLDRLVCANSPLARTEPNQVTKFHALKAPGIGIQLYLERIHKYASCSSQCFILALIYIDRLIQRNNFLLTELNVHRVIVTAILLAAKFFDDAYYNNAYYAKVGGVLISEMNGLEVDFLFRINFSLHVTPQLFEQYRAELLSHSVAENMPVPPPPPVPQAPPQYMIQQQQHFPVHLPQHEALALQNELVQQHQQPQIMAMSTTNGMTMNYLQQVPPHITPSPPQPPASSAVATNNNGADEMMISVDRTTLRANLPHLFPQQDFGYLQRANSMPLKSLTPSQQIQMNHPVQPLSAPAMMGMIPGATGNEQFVVLDNQVYQLPGTGMLAPHHRQAASTNNVIMDASDLIHHVHAVAAAQHPGVAAGHHGVSGFVSREAAVAQRFAAAQMVAGVSGGL